MNDSFSFLVLLWWLLTLKAGLIATAVLLNVLFPFRFESVAETSRTQPWRCLAIGGGNLVAALLVMALLGSVGLNLLVLLILLLIFVVAALGFAVVYLEVGRRVAPDETRSVRQLLYGGALLEAAFFVPVLGQIMQTAFAAWGMGAVIAASMAQLGRRRREAVIADDAEGADEAATAVETPEQT